MKKEITLILDNIRSSENVGSMFRTADVAGVGKIVLGGITPTPVDRFERPNTKLVKASLGAEKSVLWEAAKDLAIYIARMKEDGYFIVAIEQAEASVDFKLLPKIIENKQKVAYVLGNEVEGVQSEILELADAVVEIPMHGQKESLNVAVTAGIILFLP